MKNTGSRKKTDDRQANMFGTAESNVVDIASRRKKTKGASRDDLCHYVFTSMVAPTLTCQHDHRIILVDPMRDLLTLSELICRGELKLVEAEKFTQLPLVALAGGRG
jgi:hypothetical protein